jgi:hypothetical protein
MIIALSLRSTGTLIERGLRLKRRARKARKHRESKVPDDPSIQGRSDFCGERLQNTAQTIDHRPDASQATKSVGKEVKLCYTESVLMESRIGVIFDLCLGQAAGRAEPEPTAGVAACGPRATSDRRRRRKGLPYHGVRRGLPRARRPLPNSPEETLSPQQLFVVI